VQQVTIVIADFLPHFSLALAGLLFFTGQEINNDRAALANPVKVSRLE
jgi:hypothetical protein